MNTTRRYHVDGGAIVVVTRTAYGRICEVIPPACYHVAVRIKPTVAAHYIAATRRMEKEKSK